MRSKAKPAPSPPGKEPSGAPGKETAAPLEQKSRPGDAKAGKEEDVHTCCGCRFPLLVALLQLVLGVSITVLAFLMAEFSPSLLLRETPYWAGALVCLVALIGFVMLCISYQPDEKTCIQFFIKVAYFLLSALSLNVCILAMAFAAYCYSQIVRFTCEPISDAVCHCKLDAADPLSRTITYQSDCSFLTNTFYLFLLIQFLLNFLAAVVGFVACFVMWKDRYQVFYVGTRMQSQAAAGGQPAKV
ncbi:sarcospan [Crotalus tigris]|uniref:sarcospan n=1 Tax=Crotalus tigris TaxID=88082 RepID=UPI00192F5FE1|nr:sarcospan [Crotalus tigris]